MLKINLELHHGYAGVSDQPIGPIFRSQPGNSPQLLKKVHLFKYTLSHLNMIYSFYQFP